jgi:hypothetical protein
VCIICNGLPNCPVCGEELDPEEKTFTCENCGEEVEEISLYDGFNMCNSCIDAHEEQIKLALKYQNDEYRN